jgi:tetratricopeptide (TPR) repeat protein
MTEMLILIKNKPTIKMKLHMRNSILAWIVLFMPLAVLSQDNIDKLIKEGVGLYDKQDYTGALSKFDAALQLQSNHDVAMYEKSLCLIRLERYSDAADLLKKVLDISKDPGLRSQAYANYGTALDLDGKPQESLKIYKKGIKEFPDNYMLHFNKGVTEAGLNDLDAASQSFQYSASLNPKHASSHNGLGRTTMGESRIKGVLAIFTFLLVEPEGRRAKENVGLLNSLIMKGVSRKDDKNVTINIDASTLDKKKPKEDDFSSAEVMLSLLAASSPDSLKTDADKMSYQLEMLISLIDERNEKDKGFFKNFYVPFFIDMKKGGMIKTACYVALTSSGKEDIFKWQNENKSTVEDFLKWVEEYKWAKKE